MCWELGAQLPDGWSGGTGSGKEGLHWQAGPHFAPRLRVSGLCRSWLWDHCHQMWPGLKHGPAEAGGASVGSDNWWQLTSPSWASRAWGGLQGGQPWCLCHLGSLIAADLMPLLLSSQREPQGAVGCRRLQITSSRCRPLLFWPIPGPLVLKEAECVSFT